jgi:hypothetical protein
MKILAVCGCAALLAPLHGFAADFARTDFGYGTTLSTDGSAPVYQMPLPLVVYQHTVHADLSDIRVVNGSGEVVPYGLRRAAGDAASQASPVPLAVFPLRGQSIELADSLKLQLRAGGASVEIQRPSGGVKPAPVTGYLLDARSIAASLSALTLTWGDDAADFSTRARVEASDDLNQWRPVGEGPLVNLHYAGQQFLQPRIGLSPVAAKFLRLSWVDRPPPVEITAVSGTPSTARVEIRRLSVSAPGTIVAAKPGEYEIDLGAHVPLDRVNLELPEINTVVAAEFDAKSEPTAAWQAVGHTTLYRLHVNGGAELSNPPLPISVSTARYWRVRVARDGGGLGHGVPTFTGGWLPDELVFVARGNGPFELLYGSSAAKAASVPVQTLTPPVTGSPIGGSPITAGNAVASDPVTIGGADRLKVGPPPPPYRIILLWSVLVLGVGLLGWMAWQLSRQMPAR